MASNNPAERKRIASSGAVARNLKYGPPLKNLQHTKEDRINYGKKSHMRNLSLNPNHQTDAGKKSRLYENQIASILVDTNYDHVFLPSQVCDRICIKDGQIFFIEIKKNSKQKLRPLQKKFKNLIGDNYIIIHGNY